VCTSAFWVVLAVAALAPEQMATPPMLVVHALHVLGWPSSFWMGVVRPATPAKA